MLISSALDEVEKAIPSQWGAFAGFVDRVATELTRKRPVELFFEVGPVDKVGFQLMLDRHVCVPGLFIHRMQLLLHIVSSLGTQQVLLNEGSAKVPKPYLPLLVKDT